MADEKVGRAESESVGMKTQFKAERIEWQRIGSGEEKALLKVRGQSVFESDLDKQRHPIVGFHLKGNCPDCGHFTVGVCPASNVNVPPLEVAFGSARGQALLASSPTVLGARFSGLGVANEQRVNKTRITVCVMTCRCTHEHLAAIQPERPSNRIESPAVPASSGSVPKPAETAASNFGCGSSWLVRVEYSVLIGKRQKLVSAAPPKQEEEAEYWQSASVIASATPGALGTIQGIASKWQTALTGVLGLLSVAALIGGRDALAKVDGHARMFIGISGATAIGTSALAIFCFAIASAGIPRVRSLNSPEALSNADLEPMRQAWWTQWIFRLAFCLAFLSLGASGLAVRYLWYGNPAEPPSNVQITVQHGRNGGSVMLCGEVSIDPDVGLTVEPSSGGPSRTYPLSRISAIANC